MEVFDRDALEAYKGAIHQLIPLHKWDYIDGFDRQRGKSPRDDQWQRDYDFMELQAATSKGSNLGFRMSEADIIVDMDPRNMDISMADAVKQISERYGVALSEGFHVETGGGGLHIYLIVPTAWVGTKFRNGLLEFPGVEFKSYGKQVVAAGSKHPDGGMYEAAGKFEERVRASGKLLHALKREAVTNERERTLSNEQLAEHLAALNAEDYADNESWLQMAMSCYAATGGGGVEEFVDWSLSDSTYAEREGDIRARWDSISVGGGITIATLLKAVSDAGHQHLLREDPKVAFAAEPISEADLKFIDAQPKIDALFDRSKDGKPKRTVDNVKRAIVGLGIIPSRNILTARNVIEGTFETLNKYFPNAGAVVSDDMLHGLRAAITEEYNFEPTIQQTSEGLSALALLNQFHPIRDYIDALEWDGRDRIASFFTDYCETEMTPYTVAVAEVMFKAAVGRVYHPGIKYDTMVILEGIQGCGKSTLVKHLGGEWALEGLPNKSDMNDKDVIQQIQGSWIVEVEELAVMRKSDIDSMKAFLTRQVDTARFAYAREAREYPRQCIFIGTTNDDEYLLDSTGNRRFLPIKVGDIQLSSIEQDRDQIWAQAKIMWDKNPTEKGLMLPEDIWGAAAVEQGHRRVADPIEFGLARYLHHDDREGTDFMTQEAILFEIMHKVSSELSSADLRRLTRAMHAIPGWRTAKRTDEKGHVLKGIERYSR